MENLVSYITAFFTTTVGMILLIIFGVAALVFAIIMGINPRESGKKEMK